MVSAKNMFAQNTLEGDTVKLAPPENEQITLINDFKFNNIEYDIYKKQIQD